MRRFLAVAVVLAGCGAPAFQGGLTAKGAVVVNVFTSEAVGHRPRMDRAFEEPTYPYRRAPSSPLQKTALAMADGRIFFVTVQGIACASLVERRILWTTPVEDASEALLSVDSGGVNVYAGETLYRLDAATGRVIRSRAGVPAGLRLSRTRFELILWDFDYLEATDAATLERLWHVSESEATGRMLSVVCGDDRIIVERFDPMQGYAHSSVRDGRTGTQQWGALGRPVGVGRDRVFFMKDWQQQLWVRGLERGQLLSTVRLEFPLDERIVFGPGFLMYRSRQPYFDRVFDVGSSATRTHVRWRDEMLLYDLDTVKLAWFRKDDGNDAVDATAQGRLIAVARGRADADAIVYHGLEIFERTSGASLARIDIEGGFVGFAVWHRWAAAITSKGRLEVYELSF